jgi:hypothetical protein
MAAVYSRGNQNIKYAMKEDSIVPKLTFQVMPQLLLHILKSGVS